MTCKDCFHFKACSKGSKDGLPRFVVKEIACNNVEDLCDSFEDKSKVENALEKQIPKKVEVIDKNYGYYSCRACGSAVTYRVHKYCCRCGQALEWGDTE